MPDIEFLSGSADADDADEELSGGSRRRSLRWMGGAGLAAVVIGAVVVAATRGGDTAPRPPTPSASSPGPSSPSSSAAGSASANSISGLKPVFLGPYSGEPVLDVAVLGRSIWVLQSDGLHVTAGAGRHDILQLPAGLQGVRLVPDPGSGIVWMVAKGLAQAYNRSVSAVIGARVPAFTDAAALDGRLFVISGSDLLEVGPDHPVARTILSGLGPLATLAADPTRHRLVLAGLDGPTPIWAVTPRGYGRAHVDRHARVSIIKASLRVANGRIWLAGFDTGGGVLMELDQRTLKPVLHSSLDPLIEPGAVLVESGTDALWLREGTGGDLLRCIDPATGDATQSWPVSGHVASAAGRAVVGTGSGGLYLDLRTCPG